MKTNITKNLIMLFLIFSNSIVCMAQSGTCGGATWRLEYTTLTISGSGSGIMTNFYKAGSPWYQYRSNIKKVIIEDDVRSVGDYAFESLNNVDTVILGKDISYIGKFGFASCTNLKKINFPSALTKIGDAAFETVALDSVFLPDNVSIDGFAFANSGLVYLNVDGTIGLNAFRENKNLKTVVIRSGTVGYTAFYGCNHLDSLEIRDGVTDIEVGAFAECNSLKKIKIPPTVLKVGQEAFFQCENLEIIDIAAISINIEAFNKCNNIRSLILQEGVRSFASIIPGKLDTLFIPSTLTYIGYIVNHHITSFGVDKDNNSYSASDGILFDKNKTILYSFPSKKTGGYSIPNTVEKIGSGAFKESKLSSIEIPLSVTEIGTNAFEKSELQTISIPESATQIGSHIFSYSLIERISLPKSWKTIPSSAFYGCEKLVDIQLNEGITDIDSDAFGNCTKLESISLPASVENYKERIFSGCASLEKIEVKRQYPAWVTENVFDGIEEQDKITLVVPPGSKSMYETADVWKDFGTIIENPVGNEQIITGTSFKIYPNPADDYLIVESNDVSSGSDLNIFGMNGSLIDKQKISGIRTVIDLSSYPKGAYIIHVNGQSMKFIKK